MPTPTPTSIISRVVFSDTLIGAFCLVVPLSGNIRKVKLPPPSPLNPSYSTSEDCKILHKPQAAAVPRLPHIMLTSTVSLLSCTFSSSAWSPLLPLPYTM